MGERIAPDVKGEYYPDLLPQNSDLEELISKFKSNGHGAWVVGGAVRDCILGLNPMEFDICTDANPEQTIDIFERTIPTGVEFGTVTVRINESFFEVTTLRSESNYSDGRRPKIVNWGTSLYEDLSRRDFTINSMAYDLNDKLLFDPFNGKKDLQNGVLSAVGKAKQRLSEDGLRIMRAYRFMDRGSKGVWLPDKELSDALIDNRSMLTMVSIERVWSELLRIITGINAGKVLDRMNYDGVLSLILGIPIRSDLFNAVDILDPEIEARFATLLTDSSKEEVDGILSKLKVSKKVSNRTKLLHFLSNNIPEKFDLRIYRATLGKDVTLHISIRKALGLPIGDMEGSLEYPYDLDPIVTGEWLMNKTGLGPGIRLGRLKDWLFRIQIDRGLTQIDQLETVLCTIPWAYGEPTQWPKPTWL